MPNNLKGIHGQIDDVNKDWNGSECSSRDVMSRPSTRVIKPLTHVIFFTLKKLRAGSPISVELRGGHHYDSGSMAGLSASGTSQNKPIGRDIVIPANDGDN